MPRSNLQARKAFLSRFVEDLRQAEAALLEDELPPAHLRQPLLAVGHLFNFSRISLLTQRFGWSPLTPRQQQRMLERDMADYVEVDDPVNRLRLRIVRSFLFYHSSDHLLGRPIIDERLQMRAETMERLGLGDTSVLGLQRVLCASMLEALRQRLFTGLMRTYDQLEHRPAVLTTSAA